MQHPTDTTHPSAQDLLSTAAAKRCAEAFARAQHAIAEHLRQEPGGSPHAVLRVSQKDTDYQAMPYEQKSNKFSAHQKMSIAQTAPSDDVFADLYTAFAQHPVVGVFLTDHFSQHITFTTHGENVRIKIQNGNHLAFQTPFEDVSTIANTLRTMAAVYQDEPEDLLLTDGYFKLLSRAKICRNVARALKPLFFLTDEQDLFCWTPVHNLAQTADKTAALYTLDSEIWVHTKNTGTSQEKAKRNLQRIMDNAHPNTRYRVAVLEGPL